MTNLVYWYGAYADPANAYSFVVSSKLVSYKDGVKKGHDTLPKAMQKKLDADDGKKTLPAALRQEVRALEEMKEDLEKEPHERRGRLPSFVERYDESEVDDDSHDNDDSDFGLLSDDSIDDPASLPRAKHHENTNAKSDGGDTEEKTKAKPKSKAKSNKWKKRGPVDNESEPAPQPKKKKGTTHLVIVDDMADIGDNELNEEAKAPERTKQEDEGLERAQVR